MDATTSAQIIDLYNSLANNQYHIFDAVIKLVSVFFAISSGFAIFWNTRQTKKVINDTINEKFESGLKDFQTKIDNFENDKKTIIDNIKEEDKNYIDEKNNLLKEKLDSENKFNNAEFNRMMGIFLYDKSNFSSAFGWFFESLDLYIQTDKGEGIRIVVDYLVKIINNGIELIARDNYISEIDEYIKVTKKINNTLSNEKKIIIKGLEEIKKENSKPNKTTPPVVETGEVIPPKN